MPVETRNRVVCTGCAVLCDDIALEMQFDAIQKVHNACLRGNEKLSCSKSKERLTEVHLKEGGIPRAVELDVAIKATRDLLHAAKNPLMVGLARTSNEAQELALRLARKYNITVSIPDLHVNEAITKSVIDHGIIYFTLGEAINNADLLIFWGTN
nr:hypothetical protein [Candidatus Sigynarchaeota archaeon]